jgi:hypothetical protein
VPEVNRLATAFPLAVGGLFFGVGAVDFGAWQDSLNRNKKALRYAAFFRLSTAPALQGYGNNSRP